MELISHGQRIRKATLAFIQEINRQERVATDLREAKRLAHLKDEENKRKRYIQDAKDWISSVS